MTGKLTRAPEAHRLELPLGTRRVVLETGRLARQADAAVLVAEADTRVLVTVVGAAEARPGIDFFPLVVEYREKLAAGGRIPGSFLRREGRITDREVLASRLIDRSLRPLFPDGYRSEVQVQATVLSAGPGADPQSLALLGAGVAVHLSDVPFDGPVLGCRSALYRDRTVLLPVPAELDEAAADLVVSVGPHGLVMVEGEARSVPHDALLDHLLATVDRLDALRAEVDAFRGRAGRPKRPFAVPAAPAPWTAACEAACGEALRGALTIAGKQDRAQAVAAAKDAFLAGLPADAPGGGDGGEALPPLPGRAEGAALFKDLQKRLVRERIVGEGLRLDGRGPADIRPIWCETSWLPRVHGSAVFTRGETQALVTCTLGSGDEAQLVENVFGKQQHRFLLHYNFPPYSVGEVRPLRGPGRREVGHGNLALRALTPVLPGYDVFPYTIRVESDIAESNGSSSMATVCGGCLALMDAGVPVARPVAGIAMGLVEVGGEVAVLSDILGDEDHLGDMDFKLCGTAEGITALQMDNKIGGLSRDVLARAMSQARDGLDWILACMAEGLAGPRPEVAAHAPQVHGLRIMPHLIGALIGPKGATIKAIQEQSGATIAVDDTGLVTIYASEGPAMRKALEAVNQVVGTVRVGGTYEAEVEAVKPFGAFVRIYDSARGLLPAEAYGGQPPAEGARVEVRVTGVDRRGRLQLERA
ncbi:MAG: polyribonucleotide nucleotidyltransferase [Planctomycetota bacterium]